MPKPTKDNVEVITAEDARNEWPTTSKAIATSGLSARTIENAVRSGSLDYVYDQLKTRHFDPDQLAALTGVANEKQIEADLASDIIKQSRQTIKDLSEANAKLLRLGTGPAFRAMRILKGENAALRERCKDLEERHLKNIEAFEQALNASHQRDLERLRAEAKEKRFDQGFTTLMSQVPDIIAQVTFKKSIDSLLTTLTPEQQSLLFEMMTEPQKALLGRIMGQRGSSSEKKRSPADQDDPGKEANPNSGEAKKE